MEEFNALRVMIYIFSMMIGLVTIAKQFKLKGTIGTSIKIISLGFFFSVSSLLFQTLLVMMEEQIQDPIWEPILDIGSTMVLVLGIGLILFGLWKISLFFDEIHNQAQKHTLSAIKDQNE
ncbi:MAG: hypothetical protein JSW11_17320 [Candidatus Heimdallarchaeota archaeon]|nr:MAG: hypothetical protein JSW11_17320 [Candidatus Heimdallarchaeota archaeon]